MDAIYYADVAREFLPHYFQMFAEGSSHLAPMYAENVQLRIGNTTSVRGREAALVEIFKLTGLALVSSTKSSVSQPYGAEGSVIITANVKSDSHHYVATFILALVGEGNRYGIIDQLLHPIPE
jgi:hypothetical protein